MKKSKKHLFLGDSVKIKNSPEIPFDSSLVVTGTVAILLRSTSWRGTSYGSIGINFEKFIEEMRKLQLLDKIETFLPLLHNLDGFLEKPTGRFILRKDLEPIETDGAENSNEDYIRKAIYDGYTMQGMEMRKSILKMLVDIEQSNKDLVYHEDCLKAAVKRINDSNLEIVKTNKKIKTISEKKLTKYDESLYGKILNHSKIKKVEYDMIGGSHCLIITTKDLEISDRRFESYNVGAFKILIPMDKTSEILIANYKKQVRVGYLNHPCIREFQPCFGQVLVNEIKKFSDAGHYAEIIYLIIRFLENPNYDTPHIHASLFKYAQKVTIRPRENSDWFNLAYWRENEKFDPDKWADDTRDVDTNNENNECTDQDDPVICSRCGRPVDDCRCVEDDENEEEERRIEEEEERESQF